MHFAVNGEVICHGCQQSFETNTILKYLNHQDCETCYETYTESQLQDLKQKSIQLTEFKNHIWTKTERATKRKENYQKLKKNPKQYRSFAEKRKQYRKEQIPKLIEKRKRQRLSQFKFDRQQKENHFWRNLENEKALIEIILQKEMNRLKSKSIAEEFYYLQVLQEQLSF